MASEEPVASKRGGARTGAGLPPIIGGQKVIVILSPADLDLLDNSGKGTRSEKIRRAIRALASVEKTPV